MLIQSMSFLLYTIELTFFYQHLLFPQILYVLQNIIKIVNNGFYYHYRINKNVLNLSIHIFTFRISNDY